MIKFRELQSIALWFHIPMWVVAGSCIVIVGAYHAGVGESERKETVTTTLLSTAPLMNLDQLSQIRVTDL